MKRKLSFCLLLWPILMVAQNITWTEQTEPGLPMGVRLFKGEGTQPLIRAWYLDVDMNNPQLAVRSYISQIASKKESVPAFAARVGAIAAVNGGFFNVNDGSSYSTVVYPNQVRAQNVASVTRDNKVYPVTRSLFSLNTARIPAVDWIYHFGGLPADIYRFSQPTANVPGTPAAVPLKSQGTSYSDILTGIGGGPTLIKNGQINITYNEEVFWGSGVGLDNGDPRTAVGYTADHHVLLMVVDGRQSASVGVSLPQLANILQSLGCVEAMNLDGGGSTQMAVGNKLINLPQGSATDLRAVPTILAVVHSDSLIAKPKQIYYEKIIDTADPQCQIVGSGWFESANAGYYGGSKSLLNTKGNGDKYVRFRVNLPKAAEYEIYGWWVASSNRCTDTPFIVHRQGRSDTVRVDQTANGSVWSRIGKFAFAADSSEAVIVSNAATKGTYVVADAVRIISYDPSIPTKVGESTGGSGPQRPDIRQNYPNPFNARTTFMYFLPTTARVCVTIYDCRGRRVTTLEEGIKPAGEYRIDFDGSDLPSGVYICRWQADEDFKTIKMILLR